MQVRSTGLLSSILGTPLEFIRSCSRYRDLIVQLMMREIAARYRGTALGLCWSFVTPLLMLLIYTCVFSIVMKARWGDHLHQSEGIAQFAMILYAGLIPYNMFAEIANRSSTLVLDSPNYVKKVAFPLEILPVVVVSAAMVNSLISIGVLVSLGFLVTGIFSHTFFLFPIVLIPLVLLCLGASWLLASLGVYARDIRNGMEIFVQMLLFLSPVFYPVSMVPESLRGFLALNPFTSILGNFRAVILWNEYPDWISWGLMTAATFVFALWAYLWFMRTRDGFADVM